MAWIAEGPLTALAFCWRIERPDGAGLALTSSDREMWRGGVRYRPSPGVTPAAISRVLAPDADESEISGAITSDALSSRDLEQGRWNGSAVALTAFDWIQVDRDADGVPLLAGELGEVAIGDDAFSADLRGAAAKLSQPPCPRTSPECRAALADKCCRVDLAARTTRATVASADGNLLQLGEAIDERYLFGRLRFLAGENCGLTTTVLGVNGAQLALRDRPPRAVEAGTLVELREGCDKRFATCKGRFANSANFRGEPHLPGTDLLTRYPGS